MLSEVSLKLDYIRYKCSLGKLKIRNSLKLMKMDVESFFERWKYSCTYKSDEVLVNTCENKLQK